MKALFGFLSLLISVGLLAQDSAHQGAAKFAPPDGKKLLIIGQDLGAVGGLDGYPDGYIDHITAPPAGVTTYTSLPSLGGLAERANWGAGDVHAQAYLNDTAFSNATIAIGLYLVNELKNITKGHNDASIRRLAQWIKLTNRPVFLRIGYEFDGPWNNYKPKQFIKAWKHIVHLFDELEVWNVAYVWQSAGVNTANIEDWYPGDEYVNWLGYSHFDGPSPGQRMRDFANAHDKPIMIAEATPRIDLGKGHGPNQWDHWFKPLFERIYTNDNIKALAYIHADWNKQPLWRGQGWGDSRVNRNEAVKTAWMAEMAKSFWCLGDEELFNTLQFEAWNNDQ